MHRRMISFLLSAVLVIGLLCGVVPSASAASDMKASKDCIELIKKLEGFSEYPFYDYGQWTVGYGTACPSEDLKRYEKDGITEAEAITLMQEFVADFESKLNSFLNSNKIKVNQHQFDALLCFTYNLGGNWMNNSSAFRTAVLNGYTGNEFIFAISRWCTANGELLTHLVERRLVEANLYLNGVYQDAPPVNYRYVIFDSNLEDAVTDVRVQGYDASTSSSVRAVASKSGYTFMGWFTQPDGGEQVKKLDSEVSVTTLYAHWKEVPAVNEEVIATGVVTASKLNVRSGAGMEHEVVGALYRGDIVSVYEITTVGGSDWGRTVRGWICLDYVQEGTEEEEKEPEATEPEATEPEATEPEATEPEATEPGQDEQQKEPETSVDQDTVIATGRVVNCTSLRIRSGAGTNHSQVGSLSVGTNVEIYEYATVNGTVWGRISKGWICVTGYVKLNEGSAEVGSAGTVANCTSLNVRAGAGTNFAKVGNLAKGTRVEVFETTKVNGATWGRISQGWVHMNYIQLDGSSTSGSTSNSGSTGSGSGTSNSGSSSSGGSFSGKTGTVTGTDELRVRSGPGTHNAQVGTLKRGARVTILETTKVGNATWGRISKGWISLYYVDLDASAVGSVKTVTANSLNIRSGPGTNNDKVGSYVKGNRVTILETTVVGNTIWGRTDKGWISMDYVA